MANVNLKTDFRNGETLFDYQLNNNFKAIEEALKVANAIIWQDNADKVVTFRGNTEELKAREIIDGQILYNTDTGESYIDYEGKRISTGSGNAIHIGENAPTNASTQLWIDRDELAGVGSEVVNSLEGNQERMAPSVAAVKKGLKEYYSMEEQVVGTWMGKPLYRKTIAVGSLPNAGTIDVPTGVNNIDTIMFDLAHSFWSNGNSYYPFTLASANGPEYVAYSAVLSCHDKTSGEIEVIAGTDRTGYSAYVTILYTKTTDTV